jgi:heme oxygenase (mycobilin-producing)
MNIPVVGINICSVPKGKEEEFIRWWQGMRETLIRGGGVGFVSGRLHRNLEADARFNFINIAQWENELYSAAVIRSAAQLKAEVKELGVEMTPGLFAVVSEY